jgi:hypothetical protein
MFDPPVPPELSLPGRPCMSQIATTDRLAGIVRSTSPAIGRRDNEENSAIGGIWRKTIHAVADHWN